MERLINHLNCTYYCTLHFISHFTFHIAKSDENPVSTRNVIAAWRLDDQQESASPRQPGRGRRRAGASVRANRSSDSHLTSQLAAAAQSARPDRRDCMPDKQTRQLHSHCCQQLSLLHGSLHKIKLYLIVSWSFSLQTDNVM